MKLIKPNFSHGKKLINKVKLTNLKNQEGKKCVPIMEMTWETKFMGGGRHAMLEMHF